MDKQLLIETENLCKSFRGRRIVDGINLKVEEGEIYGFLGPNGSGKTTTIRMLLGLVYPNKGNIYLNGFNIKKDLEKGLLKTGAIVESPSFYSYLSGYDNLKLMANLYQGLPKSRIDEVLEIVNLKDRAKDKVRTYSLGMKQRLGIAMALLNDPKLVILDEPTNGLDPQGMKDIRDLIIRLSKEHGITFFISSHLLHEVEQICTQVGVLKNGKLLVQGPVSELLGTEYEVVEVRTKDTEKAMSVLNGLDFIKSAAPSENGVMVEMDKGNGARLNQILISNGVEVEFLSQKVNTLEDFFLKLTGREQNA